VGHLADGALRRMVDEPLAISERDRLHYEGCARCQARRQALARDAEAVAALLDGPAPEPDLAGVLASVRSVAPAPRSERVWARLAVDARRLGRPALLAAAVAAVAIPAFAYGAVQFNQIYAPTNAPVTTATVNTPSQAEIAGLPDLSSYGTATWVTKAQTQTGVTADEAKQATGITPPAIPAAYSGKPVTYTTVSASEAKFTFADNAQNQAGGVAGAVLDIKGGPAVVEVIGSLPTGQSARTITPDQIPLVIAVSKAPVVTSTGPTVPQLESFLVAQPGIAGNPDLVQEIRSIGDPIAAGELVLPIPAEYATSTPATINGVQGQVVADKSGELRAAVWEKGTTVYAVGGHLDQSTLLGIANSVS
jgi:hypothetical protein